MYKVQNNKYKLLLFDFFSVLELKQEILTLYFIILCTH